MEKHLIELIKQLKEFDTFHQEYQDNNNNYTLDKKGNTITIVLKENKAKKEFEEWLSNMDEDILNELWNKLAGQLPNLDKSYDSGNYKAVITKVKAQANEIIYNRIKELQKLIS